MSDRITEKNLEPSTDMSQKTQKDAWYYSVVLVKILTLVIGFVIEEWSLAFWNWIPLVLLFRYLEGRPKSLRRLVILRGFTVLIVFALAVMGFLNGALISDQAIIMQFIFSASLAMVVFLYYLFVFLKKKVVLKAPDHLRLWDFGRAFGVVLSVNLLAFVFYWSGWFLPTEFVAQQLVTEVNQKRYVPTQSSFFGIYDYVQGVPGITADRRVELGETHDDLYDASIVAVEEDLVFLKGETHYTAPIPGVQGFVLFQRIGYEFEIVPFAPVYDLYRQDGDILLSLREYPFRSFIQRVVLSDQGRILIDLPIDPVESNNLSELYLQYRFNEEQEELISPYIHTFGEYFVDQEEKLKLFQESIEELVPAVESFESVFGDLRQP